MAYLVMMENLHKIHFIVLVVCFFMVGQSASAADFAYTRDLTLGSRGADVTALQQALIDTGFLKIVAPTGYFGTITRAAVGSWQTSLGISPAAGYFGKVSRSKMVMVAPLAPIIPLTTNVAATTTPTIATTTVAAMATHNGSPVRLTIPKLGVDAAFQYNGLTADGTMEIPNNITDAGWYTGSPHPGDKGNAIVTGHVAQVRKSIVTKQGIFFDLKNLVPGDNLYVINDKGETSTFVVRVIRLYDANADATDVFMAKDNGAHLILITCEGVWNQAQLEYSQRLVVFADKVQ